MREDCKFVKGGFFLSLAFAFGGVRVAAFGLTLSLPCEAFGFHPKDPFLIPSPPFPALDVVVERLFFLGRVYFAFFEFVGDVITIVVRVGVGAVF